MSVQIAELVLQARTDSLKRAKGDMVDLRTEGVKTDQGVGKAMGGVNKSFDKVGVAAKGMAAAATAAFGALAAGASIGSAISKQLAFGSALAETSTLLNGNAKQMAVVEQASRDLAQTYGGTATAQAKAFYQAISAGASSAAEAATLLDTANQLAIGGVTDVTVAVDILTTATNVYASEGLKAADASDALFVAMKAGKTTITELATSLGKVLPLSQNLGVSFDETAGAVAALTKSGIATTEAVTGLRAAMTAVLGPSKEATDLAAQLGIDFSAAGLKAQGFAEFMADVTAKTGGSSEAMQTLFGSVEATTVALSLSGAAGGFLNDILGDMTEKAGATSAAFRLMADDDAKRLDAALSKIEDVMLGVGAAALTSLVPAVEAAASAVVLVAENADVFAISLGTLAAMQIPNAVAGLVTLSAWLATSEGLFIAGAIASQGMALAMNALPFVAVVTAVTTFVRVGGAIQDVRAASSDLRAELGELTEAHSRLDGVMVAYHNNLTEANLNSAISAAEITKAQTQAAVESAEAVLETQQRLSDLLYLGLPVESLGLKKAREALQELQGELIGTEALLSALDEVAKRYNLTTDETGDTNDDVTRSLKGMSEATFSVIPAMSELEAIYGVSAEAARDLLQAQNDLAVFDTQQGIAAAVKATSDLVGEMGLAADEAASLQAALAEVGEADTLRGQAQAAGEAAQELHDAAGGAENMDRSTREAYQALLDASLGAAELSQQVATASANTTALGSFIAGLAPQFAPAIAAANQLATALGGVIGQIGGVARALASMSPIGAAVAQSLGGLGTVFKSISTGSVSAASRLLGEVGNNLKGVWKEATTTNATVEDLSKTLAKQFAPAVGSSGGGGSGAAGAAADLKREMRAAEKEAKALQAAMDRPLITVIDGAANALGDFVSGQIKSFKDLGKSILSSIQQAISQAVSFAISNPIKIALGLSGGIGGSAASAATGAPGVPGGGGLLSGLLGGFGTSGGGILGGLAGGTGLLGGLGNAVSGGIANIFSFGANAAAAGGGLAASIGAAIPAIGIVAAAFSFFKSKTVELDKGLRVTATGMDVLVDSFRTLEKTKFWGLSKKVRTSYEAAAAEIANPIQTAINEIGASVIDLADVLNLQTDRIDNARFEFEISTKDKDDEQIQKEIEEKLGGLADSFTNAIVGTWVEFLPDEAAIAQIDKQMRSLNNLGGRGGDQWAATRLPGLDADREAAQTAIEIQHVSEEFAALQKEGEGSFQTLSRIVASLEAVNGGMGLLGLALREVSLEGAGAAANFVDLFGSIESMNDAIGFFYQNFFTSSERMTDAAESLFAEFDRLGVTIPNTREEFRALVEAADRAGDTDLLANLLQLAPAFVNVADASAALTGTAVDLAGAQAAVSSAFAEYEQAVGREIARLRAEANTALEPLVTAITEAQAAADGASQSLDGAMSSLRSFVSAQISAAEDAAEAVIGPLQDQIDSYADTAETAADRLDAAFDQVQNNIEAQVEAIQTAAATAIGALEEELAGLEATAANSAVAMQNAFDALEQAVANDIATIENDLNTAVTALNDTAQAARNMADQARSSVEAIYRAVHSGLDEQEAQIRASYAAQIDTTSAAISAATDASSGFVDALRDIESALSSRRFEGAASELVAYRTAQEQIRSFAGGASYTQDQLSGALAGVSQPSQQFFGSRFDYEVDFARTSADLRALRDQAEGQISEGQQQITLLEQQSTTLEQMRDADLAAIAAQRAEADALYNATIASLNGQQVGNASLAALQAASVEALATAQAATTAEQEAATQIAEINAQAEQQITELQAILEANRISGAAAIGTEAAVSALNEAVAANTAAQDALNARQADINAEIASLSATATEQVEALNAQLQTAQAEYDAALGIESGITDVAASIEAMRTAAAEYGAAQADYLAILAANTEEIATVEAARDAQISALNAQLETAQALYDTATGQAITLTSIDAHMAAFNGALAEYTAAQITLSDVIAANQPLIDSINSALDAQVAVLTDQLEAFRSEIAPVSDLPGALTALQQAIDNLAAVGQGGSRDLVREQLDVLYQRTLGRNVDDPGAAYWSQEILNGMSLAGVEANLLRSNEYRDNVFTPDLDALYQDILGRSVGAAGAAYYWQDFLNGRSLDEIAQTLMASPEAMGIPSYASGTDFHPGGMAIVGERGPELVNLPRGSGVSTAGNTRQMLDNSDLREEIRQLLEEMRESNRTAQITRDRIARNTRNIADDMDEIVSVGLNSTVTPADGAVFKTEAA